MLLLGLLPLMVSAQISPAVAARQWRELHERSILDEFVELLRVPNTGQDPASMQRNAELIARMLQRRGVATRFLEADGAPPVVYGELLNPEATRTLVFYAHYDGQPADPSKWNSGDPFKPTLMSGLIEVGGLPIPLPRPGWPSDSEWRLYARSSGDDKAAIVSIATALEALQHRNVPISSNLKFFIEGEEEGGSPNLMALLKQHRELLAGDAWFFVDGPVHQNRQQCIIFGVRGVVSIELTVYGPRNDLHSGHYGNWVPNPALQIAQLLATFKDEDDHVLVENFYENIVPLGEVEQQAIAEAPDYGPSLRQELWLSRTAGDNEARLEDVINQPSLNIRGVSAGAVGADAHNIIPAKATASLDIRLVKGMDHQATVDRIIEHIRQQGFYVTETEPGEDIRLANEKVCKVSVGDGYNASRTPMDSELAQQVIAAVERARGPVIKLPTMGGSLPLYAIEQVLGAPTIIVPVANHDDNQHSHNENIRLQNLWDGIETMAALLALEPSCGSEPCSAEEPSSDLLEPTP
jgi:acetylornithine deacetylase/succinyl-diaminopimelate desuccinylase-like protein